LAERWRSDLAGWLDRFRRSLENWRAATYQQSAAGDARGIQQFELSSRASVTPGMLLRPPFREGMFPIECSWRIAFSAMSESARTITSVTVPAYGHGAATVTVQTFDKLGRPIQA